MRRRLGTSIASLLLIAGTGLATAQPASATNPDGSFALKAATGKCVEVIPDANGNFYVAGNRIQQRTCDGSPQQQWFLQDLGGVFKEHFSQHPYHIVNRMTLQCLDDMDGATNNRNPVQQWPCMPNNSNMVWGLFGPNDLGYEVGSQKAEGKCLDVTDGSLLDGARLQIYNCFDENENIAQRFTMN